MHRYCDVALPVPLDRLFTYSLPETLQRRVEPGARVLAPFGPRKLTGVAVRLHDETPDYQTRDLLRLLDEDAALPEDLIRLGRWVADYYCAPIGETLKTLLPLGGELRETKIVRLTEKGVETARQFSTRDAPDDPFVLVLRALEARPLTEHYLKKKVPGSAAAVKRMARQGFLTVEAEVEDRDPLRARDGRLLVSAGDAEPGDKKRPKGERWLLEFLAAHPGEHDVEALAVERKDAATVARRLAKTGAVKMRVARELPGQKADVPEIELNAAQQTAFDAVCEAIFQKEFRPFLLQGVTGSGKTEVYLRAIEATLAAGRSALLLVPEIALTPAMATQFFGRFGDRVAILHSAFTGWQRAEQWRRIRSGEAKVVIGTRSGVFAPVRNLGLIVVDEEHESSYKQEETPRYNARDVAVVRARNAGATIVLGSATPSLESRRNAETGKYALLELPERVNRRPMPEVEVIDMCLEFQETKRNDLFSREFVEQVERNLATGEQTMILLNRRGFSMFVMCRGCGHRIECQNCSVTLTYHRRESRLLCHYCDYSEPVPDVCPKCKHEHLHFTGSGSEKVEQALRERFAKARIARLDRDSVKGRDHYETVLNAFREGRYDILVGTQMIAKGHDIPNVTLVGVVSADVGLGIPDFRAAERTFQLLTQVAGRAGRGDQPGRVLMQSHSPGHWAIQLAAAQNYGKFYQRELGFRRQMHYPPFAAMALLLVRSKKLEEAAQWTSRLGQALTKLPQGVRLMGPASAPVARLKTEYRFQFLIKSASRRALAETVRRARDFAQAEEWPATALVVDVDPMSLL